MRMLNHHQIQWIFAAIIIIAAIGTKYITIDHWHTSGITGVYPWYIPYVFLLWSFALMGRLYYEKSRLYSVWVMAIAGVWFGIEAFKVV